MEGHKREAAPEGNPTPRGELEELRQRVADVEECVSFLGPLTPPSVGELSQRLADVEVCVLFLFFGLEEPPPRVRDALDRMKRPRLG